MVFFRAISQLLSLRYELQNYESIGSRKSRKGTENELLGVRIWGIRVPKKCLFRLVP